ncbi:MAG: Membrane protein metalloendopeptidase [candidate division WS6 bacterium GW2011_GWF2_39_15]|uniref:Membrane protein metalloendopeptidase n=1 Tax=candidate division WS6 bacterium GW2011_GWF2_39_15 TaxID=1619100 RepID=A0A0G0MPN5_9BACT|nr:MAG: Membrane protein metalloendopeptidase [candidate division WS6 bacterium GW2011_GWF2_39_15]
MRKTLNPTKTVHILLTFLLLATYGLWIGLGNRKENMVLAYSTTCPKEIANTPECLVYLQKQKEMIDKDKKNFSQNLSNEQYQQLSLLEKINYLDSQISAMERDIDALEVEMETKNVEIRILGKEIVETENNINTITQEINKLDNSIKKRISISYKYSFVTPVEILFENSNFENLLRKLKYLSETKRKDKELMEQMANQSKVLKQEETLLSEKQRSVERKRQQIEEEKTEQFKLKDQMAAQRSERASLYAESRRREQALLAQLDAARKAESSVEASIIKYIQDHPETMVNSGTVVAGSYIGQMGSTGCSTAPHLHFTIEYTSQPIGYASINPWGGYLKKGPDYWAIYGGWTYYNIHSGSFVTPLTGNAFLTQDHHRGWSGGAPYAVDMSSSDGTATYVRAVKNGTLYKGTEPICGGKYAKVVHSGGIESFYLHLK